MYPCIYRCTGLNVQVNALVNVLMHWRENVKVFMYMFLIYSYILGYVAKIIALGFSNSLLFII